MRDPLLLGAAGVGALALLHVRDPHGSGSYGYCPFLMLTGKPCPGCGGLRAMNDLTNGDIGGALSSNTMAVVLLLTLVAAWSIWIYRRWRVDADAALTIPSPVLWGLVVGFTLFGVLRWTPWGVWFRP